MFCTISGGSLSLKTTPVQAHRGFRLLTLASKYIMKPGTKAPKKNFRTRFFSMIIFVFFHILSAKEKLPVTWDTE